MRIGFRTSWAGAALALLAALSPLGSGAVPAVAQELDIEGVYDVQDGIQTRPGFDSTTAPNECPPTTMASALSGDPADSYYRNYRVQVTTDGDQAFFAPEGGGEPVFTVQLSDVDYTFTAQDPSAQFTISGIFEPDDTYGATFFIDDWAVDGVGPDGGVCSWSILGTKASEPVGEGGTTGGGAPGTTTGSGGSQPGTTTGGGGTTTTGRRTTGVNPGILIFIGLTGGTVITIGGITVRRRRRRRVPSDISEPCIPHATELNDTLNVIETLHKLKTELQRRIEVGARNHKKNLIRATIVLATETTSHIVGGVRQAILQKRRQVLQRGLGVKENWQPPSTLSPRTQQLLKTAEIAWETTKQRVVEARRKLQQIEEVWRNRIGNAIDATESNLRLWRERLTNLERQLPDALKADRELVGLPDTSDLADITRRDMLEKEDVLLAVERAEKYVRDAESALSSAGVKAERKFGYEQAEAQWSGLNARLKDVRRELRLEKAGKNRAKQIADLEEQVDGLSRNVENARKTFDEGRNNVDRATEMEAQHLEDMKRNLAEKETAQREYERSTFEAAAEEDRKYWRAREHRFVNKASIEETRLKIAEAEAELARLRAEGDPRLTVQIREAEELVRTAETEESFAQSYLEGTRRQAEREVTGSGGSSSAGVVSQTLTIGGEVVSTLLIGGTDTFRATSREETELILRQGYEWLNVMNTRLDAVDREIVEQYKRADVLKRTLDECLAAHGRPARQQPQPAEVAS